MDKSRGKAGGAERRAAVRGKSERGIGGVAREADGKGAEGPKHEGGAVEGESRRGTRYLLQEETDETQQDVSAMQTRSYQKIKTKNT